MTDHLWTPWRFKYIAGVDKNPDLCIFCDALKQNADEETLIVYRGRSNFLILNLFPYTTGHMMIVPYRHIPLLSDAHEEEMHEMIELARRCQEVLVAVYKPQGFNLGMNLGRSAGAGVAHHLHMHILPRWVGDTNFMTVIGEARVIPEDLSTTYNKLRPHFEKGARGQGAGAGKRK